MLREPALADPLAATELLGYDDDVDIATASPVPVLRRSAPEKSSRVRKSVVVRLRSLGFKAVNQLSA